MGAMKQHMIDQMNADEPACSYGKDKFKHCYRCHSKDESVYWDSCANRENREAYQDACDRDDS
jgi:hypothetical protein